MMGRLVFSLFLLTGFTSADPYLVVRSATKLDPGQSLGTLVGSWDMVIMDVAEDGSGQILSQDEQIEQFGSLANALAQARLNTIAMAETVSLCTFRGYSAGNSGGIRPPIPIVFGP